MALNRSIKFKENIKTHLRNNLMVDKLFKNVIFIMIITNLVDAITTFTDGICASQLISDNASAALSVVDPILLFSMIFATILQIGAEIICSKKMVQGDLESTKRTYTLTILISIIFGLLFMIVIYSAGEPLIRLLGATDATLVKDSKDYIFGFFAAAPFFIIYNIMLPLVNIDGGKKISYLSIGAVLIVNVIGDVIGGYIFKSTFAIGLSTTLSNVVGVLILSLHLFNKKSSFKFTFKNLSLKNDFKDVILTGLPSGAKILFIFLRTTFMNNIIPLVGGTIIFTAYSFQARIGSFIESITGGLLVATLTLSNIFYSEEDEESLNKLLKLVFKIDFTIVILLSIGLICLAEPLTLLYGVGNTLSGNDKLLVINNSIAALRINAISIPFITLGCCYLSFLQGTKRIKGAFLSTFLQSLLIPVTMISLFTFTNNYEYRFWIGLDIGFIIYPILHTLFAFIKNKKISFKVKNLFFLPKDFGVKENQCLKISIFNISDALEVADKVITFCKKNKIDKKRMYHIAGCAAELATMTVLSGFSRDHKRFHVCEMRLVYKNDDLKLRVRDDCSEFNIKDKAERIKEKDPNDFSNYSIRIVMGFAKNVEYVNLLKTNNLIITV